MWLALDQLSAALPHGDRGTNVLLADGSVHYFDAGMDLTVTQLLAIRDSGQTKDTVVGCPKKGLASDRT